MAGGGAVFLVLGGVLSDVDWRYPFLVYTSGFLILLLAVFVLFEPQRNVPTPVSKNELKFHFFRFLPIYLFSFYAMSMFYVMPTQIPHFITHNLNKSGNSYRCEFGGKLTLHGFSFTFLCETAFKI